MVEGHNPPHMITTDTATAAMPTTTDTVLAQLVAARDAAHSAWAEADAAYAANSSWETIAALGTTHAAYERAVTAVKFATATA